MPQQYYGLIAARDIAFGGVRYKRGQELPAELQTSKKQSVERSLKTGALKREILTKAEVAEAANEPDPLTQITAAAAGAVGRTTKRKDAPDGEGE